MKKLSITMSFLLLCILSCFSQVKKGVFRVYCITEYIDGYVIKAIDTGKNDTLNIVSVKKDLLWKKNHKKIEVGKIYTLCFQALIAHMAAAPPDSFVIRIKQTVIWRNGDGIKNLPVFALGTWGLWVKQ